MNSMFWLFKQLVGVGIALAGIGLALYLSSCIWDTQRSVLLQIRHVLFVLVAGPILLPILWYRSRNAPPEERPSIGALTRHVFNFRHKGDY